MHLIEFAVQGVRGFASSARAALKPGYVVLKPRSATAAPPLCGLFSALLYAEDRSGEAAFVAPGQKAGKAGITLLGTDQTTYRLIRELGGGSALQRLDPATATFDALSSDPTEVAGLLQSDAGLPSRHIFEQVFTLSSAQLPGKRAKAKGVPKPSPAPAAVAAVTGEAASFARSKLTELEREYGLTQEVAKLQYRADGLSSQLFEAEHKIKDGDRLRAQVNEAEAALRVAPTPERLGLPADIVARAERYPQIISRRDEALARLASDSQQEHGGRRVEPLTRDQKFWAGVIGGVVFFGVGLFFQGPARYLAFLDIPAFGYAALVALRYVDELQAVETASRKNEMRAVREKKILEEFEAEAQHVRQAMHALGVDTPADVVEQLGRRLMHQERVKEAKDQLTALEQDPDFARAVAEHKKLKQESDSVNAKLAEQGSYTRDLREIERDISRAKEALAQAGYASSPAPAAARAMPQLGIEDPMPALVSLGTELFQVDPVDLHRLLKDRCAQYISALTDRRFLGLEIDDDGQVLLVATGKKLPATEAPIKDLDLAYLALRLTLIEKFSARAKVPVFIEDALGLEDAKVPLFARMLKHLGTLTQVIHATGHPAFGPVADVSVTI